MRKARGIALAETLALFVVAPTAVASLCSLVMIGPLSRSQEMANRTVCMSNLNSIGRALVLYRAENDNKYPWLYDKITGWDTGKVGTNRNVDPYGEHDDPNQPKARSITAFMFILVRAGEKPGLFRCPSDANSVKEINYQNGGSKADGDAQEGEYYWDFSRAENVSYSYQAPRYVNKKTFANGLDPSQSDVAVVADMSPRYGWGGKWKPMALTDDTPQAQIQKQNSHNHLGRQVNVLYVGGNVMGCKRPDVGDSKDQIYTAYGKSFAKRRSSTSTKISDHVRPEDTFLIGPVGRK